MKILVLTLITNGPDPVTGRTPTPNARLHRVVDNAVLAEEAVPPAGSPPHISTAQRESVDVAARYGDPLFSGNVTNPIEPYAELIAYYRERWAAHGRAPADALVGAGTAGFHVAETSQQAIEEFRPAFAARLAAAARFGLPIVFPTVEDFVERSSALVGSPQQIIDKILRYHAVFGHEVLHLHVDGDGLTPRRQREILETFQAEVAPALRTAVPSRPLAGAVPRDLDDARPADEPVGVAS